MAVIKNICDLFHLVIAVVLVLSLAGGPLRHLAVVVGRLRLRRLLSKQRGHVLFA
jgi:hypothetical protein